MEIGFIYNLVKKVNTHSMKIVAVKWTHILSKPLKRQSQHMLSSSAEMFEAFLTKIVVPDPMGL